MLVRVDSPLFVCSIEAGADARDFGQHHRPTPPCFLRRRAHQEVTPSPPPPLPPFSLSPMSPLYSFLLLDPHASNPPLCSDLTRGGIPFGFIISPFAHDNEGGSSNSIATDPARCSSCGAFRNLYVSVEVKTGRWACNFCGSIEKSDDLVGAGGLDHKVPLKPQIQSPKCLTPNSWHQPPGLGGPIDLSLPLWLPKMDESDFRQLVCKIFPARLPCLEGGKGTSHFDPFLPLHPAKRKF